MSRPNIRTVGEKKLSNTARKGVRGVLRHTKKLRISKFSSCEKVVRAKKHLLRRSNGQWKLNENPPIEVLYYSIPSNTEVPTIKKPFEVQSNFKEKATPSGETYFKDVWNVYEISNTKKKGYNTKLSISNTELFCQKCGQYLSEEFPENEDEVSLKNTEQRHSLRRNASQFELTAFREVQENVEDRKKSALQSNKLSMLNEPKKSYSRKQNAENKIRSSARSAKVSRSSPLKEMNCLCDDEEIYLHKQKVNDSTNRSTAQSENLCEQKDKFRTSKIRAQTNQLPKSNTKRQFNEIERNQQEEKADGRTSTTTGQSKQLSNFNEIECQSDELEEHLQEYGIECKHACDEINSNLQKQKVKSRISANIIQSDQLSRLNSFKESDCFCGKTEKDVLEQQTEDWANSRTTRSDKLLSLNRSKQTDCQCDETEENFEQQEIESRKSRSRAQSVKLPRSTQLEKTKDERDKIETNPQKQEVQGTVRRSTDQSLKLSRLMQWEEIECLSDEMEKGLLEQKTEDLTSKRKVLADKLLRLCRFKQTECQCHKTEKYLQQQRVEYSRSRSRAQSDQLSRSSQFRKTRDEWDQVDTHPQKQKVENRISRVPAQSLNSSRLSQFEETDSLCDEMEESSVKQEVDDCINRHSTQSRKSSRLSGYEKPETPYDETEESLQEEEDEFRTNRTRAQSDKLSRLHQLKQCADMDRNAQKHLVGNRICRSIAQSERSEMFSQPFDETKRNREEQKIGGRSKSKNTAQSIQLSRLSQFKEPHYSCEEEEEYLQEYDDESRIHKTTAQSNQKLRLSQLKETKDACDNRIDGIERNYQKQKVADRSKSKNTAQSIRLSRLSQFKEPHCSCGELESHLLEQEPDNYTTRSTVQSEKLLRLSGSKNTENQCQEEEEEEDLQEYEDESRIRKTTAQSNQKLRHNQFKKTKDEYDIGINGIERNYQKQKVADRSKSIAQSIRLSRLGQFKEPQCSCRELESHLLEQEPDNYTSRSTVQSEKLLRLSGSKNTGNRCQEEEEEEEEENSQEYEDESRIRKTTDQPNQKLRLSQSKKTKDEFYNRLDGIGRSYKEQKVGDRGKSKSTAQSIQLSIVSQFQELNCLCDELESHLLEQEPDNWTNKSTVQSQKLLRLSRSKNTENLCEEEEEENSQECEDDSRIRKITTQSNEKLRISPFKKTKDEWDNGIDGIEKNSEEQKVGDGSKSKSTAQSIQLSRLSQFKEPHCSCGELESHLLEQEPDNYTNRSTVQSEKILRLTGSNNTENRYQKEEKNSEEYEDESRIRKTTAQPNQKLRISQFKKTKDECDKVERNPTNQKVEGKIRGSTAQSEPLLKLCRCSETDHLIDKTKINLLEQEVDDNISRRSAQLDKLLSLKGLEKTECQCNEGAENLQNSKLGSESDQLSRSSHSKSECDEIKKNLLDQEAQLDQLSRLSQFIEINCQCHEPDINFQKQGVQDTINRSITEPKREVKSRTGSSTAHFNQLSESNDLETMKENKDLEYIIENITEIIENITELKSYVKEIECSCEDRDSAKRKPQERKIEQSMNDIKKTERNQPNKSKKSATQPDQASRSSLFKESACQCCKAKTSEKSLQKQIDKKSIKTTTQTERSKSFISEIKGQENDIKTMNNEPENQKCTNKKQEPCEKINKCAHLKNPTDISLPKQQNLNVYKVYRAEESKYKRKTSETNNNMLGQNSVQTTEEVTSMCEICDRIENIEEVASMCEICDRIENIEKVTSMCEICDGIENTEECEDELNKHGTQVTVENISKCHQIEEHDETTSLKLSQNSKMRKQPEDTEANFGKSTAQSICMINNLLEECINQCGKCGDENADANKLVSDTIMTQPSAKESLKDERASSRKSTIQLEQMSPSQECIERCCKYEDKNPNPEYNSVRSSASAVALRQSALSQISKQDTRASSRKCTIQLEQMSPSQECIERCCTYEDKNPNPEYDSARSSASAVALRHTALSQISEQDISNGMDNNIPDECIKQCGICDDENLCTENVDDDKPISKAIVRKSTSPVETNLKDARSNVTKTTIDTDQLSQKHRKSSTPLSHMDYNLSNKCIKQCGICDDENLCTENVDDQKSISNAPVVKNLQDDRSTIRKSTIQTDQLSAKHKKRSTSLSHMDYNLSGACFKQCGICDDENLCNEYVDNGKSISNAIPRKTTLRESSVDKSFENDRKSPAVYKDNNLPDKCMKQCGICEDENSCMKNFDESLPISRPVVKRKPSPEKSLKDNRSNIPKTTIQADQKSLSLRESPEPSSVYMENNPQDEYIISTENLDSSPYPIVKRSVAKESLKNSRSSVKKSTIQEDQISQNRRKSSTPSQYMDKNLPKECTKSCNVCVNANVRQITVPESLVEENLKDGRESTRSNVRSCRKSNTVERKTIYSIEDCNFCGSGNLMQSNSTKDDKYVHVIIRRSQQNKGTKTSPVTLSRSGCTEPCAFQKKILAEKNNQELQTQRKESNQCPSCCGSYNTLFLQQPPEEDDLYVALLRQQNQKGCLIEHIIHKCQSSPSVISQMLNVINNGEKPANIESNTFLMAQTHGETLGDPKYHYLMKDADITARSDADVSTVSEDGATLDIMEKIEEPLNDKPPAYSEMEKENTEISPDIEQSSPIEKLPNADFPHTSKRLSTVSFSATSGGSTGDQQKDVIEATIEEFREKIMADSKPRYAHEDKTSLLSSIIREEKKKSLIKKSTGSSEHVTVVKNESSQSIENIENEPPANEGQPRCCGLLKPKQNKDKEKGHNKKLQSRISKMRKSVDTTEEFEFSDEEITPKISHAMKRTSNAVNRKRRPSPIVAPVSEEQRKLNEYLHNVGY